MARIEASQADPVVSETTPGPKLRTERARQGQNISGMILVLVVSLLLVAGAYAVLLAVSARPADKEINAAPAAAAASPAGVTEQAPQ